MKPSRSHRRVRETSVTYRAGRARVTERDLATLTRRLVRVFHPQLIILFGSRAYGKPRPDSDLDLLLVMDDVTSKGRRSGEIRAQLRSFPVSLDVHTRTLAELTRRLAMGDDFIQEIVGRGEQIYPKRGANGFVQVRAALERGRTQPMDNTEVVKEWVAKAEGDYLGAQSWARRSKNFRPEKLCWDCEQCVEKYLKAFLTRHRIKFERNHNFDQLYGKCFAVDSDFRLIRPFLDAVAPCKPQIRYPGHGVTEEQARAAFAATKPLRKFVRAKLGLRG